MAFVYRINKKNPFLLEIYCANFFAQNLALTVYDLNKKKVSFTRIIDDSCGPAESIEFADF